jgi:hypothetical protein
MMYTVAWQVLFVLAIDYSNEATSVSGIVNCRIVMRTCTLM